MSHVNFIINGRQYRMACEDGQEGHLLKLSKDLDRRIDQLRSQFGEIGDMRLVVMAALTVADELSEAVQKLHQAEEELAVLKEARDHANDRSKEMQEAVAAALISAAERIETVTRSLNQSLGDGIAIG